MLPDDITRRVFSSLLPDDTQIETAGYDVNTIAEELNQDLENVSVWLSANKLTLNKTKTDYMIIGSNRRVNHINITPNIFIKDREINRVKTTKSLGIMIDETLSWNAQVDQITKKVNSGVSILKRLRDILDYQTLIKNNIFINNSTTFRLLFTDLGLSG